MKPNDSNSIWNTSAPEHFPVTKKAMKPAIILCNKQCVGTEIATGLIYAASMLLWASIPVAADSGRGKTVPVRDRQTPDCTSAARMQEFRRPLSL
jgi:hypothetical protein